MLGWLIECIESTVKALQAQEVSLMGDVGELKSKVLAAERRKSESLKKVLQVEEVKRIV